jgi:hypothetical protein
LACGNPPTATYLSSRDFRDGPLVAVTHDDRNEIRTLCGYVEEGIWQGGTRLCQNCQQTFEDIAAEVEPLTSRIAQRI